MQTDHKTVGLTLSGGGSKGIAHAGVLQFLEQQDICPDMISGSSAGAIVGALYAWGRSPKEILDFFKSIYFFHWRHFTFKKPGLIDSYSFAPYFEAIFGEALIGDLKIETHITATEMLKGEMKVFGPETRIVDAILASSAVPGVLCPYTVDGHLYSDGGILNHFPTDVLEGKCDRLIGVYVSPVQNIESKNLQTIKSVMTRAFELVTASSSTRKFSSCDWLIYPHHLSGYSTFLTNKNKMDEVFKIGYEAAKDSFPLHFQKGVGE